MFMDLCSDNWLRRKAGEAAPEAGRQVNSHSLLLSQDEFDLYYLVAALERPVSLRRLASASVSSSCKAVRVVVFFPLETS